MVFSSKKWQDHWLVQETGTKEEKKSRFCIRGKRPGVKKSRDTACANAMRCMRRVPRDGARGGGGPGAKPVPLASTCDFSNPIGRALRPIASAYLHRRPSSIFRRMFHHTLPTFSRRLSHIFRRRHHNIFSKPFSNGSLAMICVSWIIS